MGNETKQNLCLKGLKSCAGFLQSKIAKRLDTRYVPHLQFVLDQGVKNQLLVSKMLDEELHPHTEEDEMEEDEMEDEDDAL
jgi:ribosome-binding factor A